VAQERLRFGRERRGLGFGVQRGKC
jgi:hypothetical protein